jgi:GNAT superfamily N-acetyltransferase
MIAEPHVGTLITVRSARRADLRAIVAMLADDALGATREDPTTVAPYERAFAKLEADPRNLLVVGEDAAGTVIACLHLTFIPSLGSRGSERALIGTVRVAAHLRGHGVGHELLEWTIDECRRRGCGVIELLSHSSRTAAHHFYETLGFTSAHTGMTLKLR